MITGFISSQDTILNTIIQLIIVILKVPTLGYTPQIGGFYFLRISNL